MLVQSISPILWYTDTRWSTCLRHWRAGSTLTHSPQLARMHSGSEHSKLVRHTDYCHLPRSLSLKMHYSEMHIASLLREPLPQRMRAVLHWPGSIIRIGHHPQGSHQELLAHYQLK